MTQAQNRLRPREPSLFLLWGLVLLNMVMWFWAVVGPLFLVLGALSFFLDLGAIGISISGFGGEPVRTTWQKLTFIALSALAGVVGIGFQWLRRRGWLKYGLPDDRGENPLFPDLEQAARARFNPCSPPTEANSIREANDGVGEDKCDRGK